MATTRSGFTNRLGFIAAAAGSAVGLGNIWKFPYETAQNGGGAFLFIYILFTFLIGFPVMVGEISMGRNTQLNPYGAYNKLGGKKWAWVGLLGVLCGVMILSFYNVIAGWAFGYFLQISFDDLLARGDYGGFFTSYTKDWVNIGLFSVAFMLITAVVVLRGVQKGIESAAKVLMPLLFILLIGLIIYALTLPNAGRGLAKYLLPDFSSINLQVINSAMGQAFFSLSLGMGALITYGSYISKKENIIASAGIVTIADTAVAVLAGLLMLPLVYMMDTPATDGGPGLVFIVLPEIFTQMGPVAGKFIGGLFFILLCLAALTSTISLLEVPVSYFVDQLKWSRKRSVIFLAALIFIIGIPSLLSAGASDALSNLSLNPDASVSFLDLVAELFSELSLPLGGGLMSIFIAYKWRTHNMSKEISSGNEKYIGSNMEKFINVMLMYVLPVILGLIFLSNLRALLSNLFGI